MKRTAKSDRLFAVAASQHGYFTSSDAKKLGYDYPHQHFHVKQGNWIRVDHGIYRLKRFPATEDEELMRWWLWSRKKATLSHETAAALYELGNLLPSKIHLTVPPDFRKAPAKSVVLHKANLSKSEIEKRNGVPLTKALRTIIDLARSHLDDERLSAIAKDAIRKGLVNSKEMLEALAKMPERVGPSAQITLQLASREAGGGDYAIDSPLGDIPQVREAPVKTTRPEVPTQRIVRELKAGLQKIYKDRLEGVWLFGSYARQEADQESDFDVLVVLKDFKSYGHEVDRTAELAADLSLKHGLTISLAFVREHEWLRGDTPFLSNVRAEALRT